MKHGNKVDPGLRPGGAETKHNHSGKMPNKSGGASAGSNHSVPDNGCWHSGSTGTGKKSRPSA